MTSGGARGPLVAPPASQGESAAREPARPTGVLGPKGAQAPRAGPSYSFHRSSVGASAALGGAQAPLLPALEGWSLDEIPIMSRTILNGALCLDGIRHPQLQDAHHALRELRPALARGTQSIHLSQLPAALGAHLEVVATGNVASATAGGARNAVEAGGDGGGDLHSPLDSATRAPRRLSGGELWGYGDGGRGFTPAPPLLAPAAGANEKESTGTALRSLASLQALMASQEGHACCAPSAGGASGTGGGGGGCGLGAPLPGAMPSHEEPALRPEEAVSALGSHSESLGHAAAMRADPDTASVASMTANVSEASAPLTTRAPSLYGPPPPGRFAGPTTIRTLHDLGNAPLGVPAEGREADGLAEGLADGPRAGSGACQAHLGATGGQLPPAPRSPNHCCIRIGSRHHGASAARETAETATADGVASQDGGGRERGAAEYASGLPTGLQLLATQHHRATDALFLELEREGIATLPVPELLHRIRRAVPGVALGDEASSAIAELCESPASSALHAPSSPTKCTAKAVREFPPADGTPSATITLRTNDAASSTEQQRPLWRPGYSPYPQGAQRLDTSCGDFCGGRQAGGDASHSHPSRAPHGPTGGRSVVRGGMPSDAPLVDCAKLWRVLHNHAAVSASACTRSHAIRTPSLCRRMDMLPCFAHPGTLGVVGPRLCIPLPA